MKQNNLNDTQFQVLQQQINQLSSQRNISGAIMFFENADVEKKDNFVNKLKTYGALSGAFDYIKSSEIQNHQNSVFYFLDNWKDLHYLDYVGYEKTFNTANTYLTFIDPEGLTLYHSGSAPYWFLNSIDTKRVIPTDVEYNETRPKTVVLKACQAP